MNILAPSAMNNTIDGLKKANYISMLIDTSNRKAIKLVQVIKHTALFLGDYFYSENEVKTKF